jgi:hypothetical protein
MRRRLAAYAITLLAGGVVVLAAPAGSWAVGLVKFVAEPKLPALPTVALNASAQTSNATMANFSVEESLLTEGWKITVAGLEGVGNSAVFAQYCPNATCGTDVKGYVTGGFTLPANSLTLQTEGAKFSGGTGKVPAFQCSSCNLDSATAVKVVSEAAAALSQTGTWKTEGCPEKSVALSTPTTLRALSNGEVYRVNIVWTLSTGP